MGYPLGDDVVAFFVDERTGEIWSPAFHSECDCGLEEEAEKRRNHAKGEDKTMHGRYVTCG